MLFKKLLVNLKLFDGEGGSAAPAAGDGDTGTMGDANGTVPGITRRGKKSGEYANVKFGKQDAAIEEDTGNTKEGSAAGGLDDGKSSDTKDRRKAFETLINGEYKDLYTEKTQSMITKRFKETKALKDSIAKTQPVLDMLMQRYNITDGDADKLKTAIENDDMYWTVAAEEAGMSVESFKELQRLKRENTAHSARETAAENERKMRERVDGWISEGEALKEKFPDFSLQDESSDPSFMSMLRAGVPVEHAYKIKYFDKIMSDTATTAAHDAEKRIIDNVRAKGAKPPENGVAAQSAFTVKDDVSKLSKKDRAEIARRVARGEKIIF